MKDKISHSLIYVILIFYASISIYPMIWMGFYSLKSNEEIFVTNPFGPPLHPNWQNYVDAVTQFHIPTYFKNSIIVATASTILSILLALMFTYVTARVQTKLTNSLRTIVVAGMFIPIQAVMAPLVIMVRNLNLSNTRWSLIIPYMALCFPFAVMVLHGFYRGLPMELEESAYLEGAGFFQTYFKIILPQMKSIISVLVIYQFISAWNEFSLALVLISDDKLKTLPLGLAAFKGQYTTAWGLTGAAMVIASIPVLVIYLIFSNKINDAIAYSGIKN